MIEHHRLCPAHTDIRKACRCMSLRGAEDDMRKSIADRVRALPSRNWVGERPDGDILYREDVLTAIREAT